MFGFKSSPEESEQGECQEECSEGCIGSTEEPRQPPQNGWPQEAYGVQAWDRGTEGDSSLPEINRAAH